MRLAGPLGEKIESPEQWIAALGRKGYRAAEMPCGQGDARLTEYVEAARRAGVTITEVGAWSNPISTDAAERGRALEKCCAGLAFAERSGARCCVNIAGSRGARWDGPDPENFIADTFALIVESVRQIIDTVRPTRSFYTLETMPWVFPDSPDNYLALIKAIDRKQFAAHLDPVNMINCPRRMYRSGEFLRECFAKLGPYIKGCHAKDIRFTQHLTMHLDECAPGQGVLDYGVYLEELAKLDPETPLVLEHLATQEEYDAAAAHIRGVAAGLGLSV